MARGRRKELQVEHDPPFEVGPGGGRLALIGVAYLAAGVAGIELAPETASPTFYEISAQVIPLLMLVLSVEVRFFDLQRMPRSARPTIRTILRGLTGTLSVGGTSSPPPDLTQAAVELWGRLLFPLGLLVALVGGELFALNVVAKASSSTANPDLIIGALWAALAAIALVALAAPPTRRD